MKYLRLIVYFSFFFFLNHNSLIAQLLWQRYENNPVFVPVPESWESTFVTHSSAGLSVIYDKQNNIYRLWYTGYPSYYYEPPGQIGYATSVDGINWERYANNPLVLPTDKDFSSVKSPSIIYDSNGGIFHMWYINSGLCYAKSSDGINWSDSLDVRFVGDIQDFSITSFKDTLRMWYCESQSPYSNLYTWSLDGRNWAEVTQIQGIGMTAVMDVFADTDTLRMFFKMVFGNGLSCAWSTDCINWYLSSESIVDGGEAWDKPIKCSVLKEESAYKMWYVGGSIDSVAHSGIGLATASLTTNIYHNNAKSPYKFEVFQNYPNPFNPSTTIEYNLPNSEKVHISIYNISGQKVKTLLSERMQKGNHTITSNFSVLASGIYFYKIKAGKFYDVKKMVLTK